MTITIAIIVVLILVALALWLTKNYPVAIVDGNFISANDWQQNWQIAFKLDPAASQQAVFDQFIESKQRQALVRRYRILFDDSTFESELKFYKKGREDEYGRILKDFFYGDEQLFVKHVLEPQVFTALLSAKYNSDTVANSQAYDKAHEILSKIKNGEKFEDLAKSSSDDQVSAQFGGDLGFVVLGQLLPELEKALLDSKLGDIRRDIVISRLGYHILYPVETAEKNGEKVWHVKHILIQTSGFENWLTPQLNQFGIWKFGKL